MCSSRRNDISFRGGMWGHQGRTLLYAHLSGTNDVRYVSAGHYPSAFKAVTLNPGESIVAETWI
jgi:hypothetical protein